MKKSFLDKLVCPFDKQDLTLNVIKMHGEEIQEGILICKHCERYYPIIQGIPIMSPDEYREASLEKPILEKWGEQLVLQNGKPTLLNTLSENKCKQLI